MKAKPIHFAKGVSIAELNQFNHALKNDYINNLISTAFKIFPFIDKVVDGIRIVNGFVSDAHAKAMDMVRSSTHKAFTNGTAIEFTWMSYNKEQTILMLTNLMNEMPPGFELCVKDDSIIIFNKKSDKILLQEIKNEEGIISTREIKRR